MKLKNLLIEYKQKLNIFIMTKTQSSKRGRGNKGKKKNYGSFSMYIYKVLKTISPDIGISKNGMSVIDNIVQDTFENIAVECSKLCRFHNKKTLSSNDVMTAVKLLLPNELASHAIMEGQKAISKYKGNS